MAPPKISNRSRIAPKFKAGHLDPHRARALKKQWLATQKIKAAYRAEKRRMGLGNVQASPDGGEADDSAKEEGDTAQADSSDGEPMARRSSVEADASSQPPTATAGQNHDAGRRGTPFFKRNERGITTGESCASVSSLREMTREAYSPASLHTHKSHPLHRRTHGKNYARPQANNASNHTEGDGKRGTPGRGLRGRGQPNMAKRMGVLLEKIKRMSQ